MSKITLHHLVEEAVGKFGGRSALELRGRILEIRI
jgi:hypothetical protein